MAADARACAQVARVNGLFVSARFITSSSDKLRMCAVISGGTAAPRVANFCSLPTNNAPASLGGFQTPAVDFGVAADPPIVDGGAQAEPSAATIIMSEAARNAGVWRGENWEEIIVSKDT